MLNIVLARCFQLVNARHTLGNRAMCLLHAQVPTLMDALRLPPGVVCYLRGGSMLLVVGLQLLALPNLAQVRPAAART